jgi:hypothetical protein
MFHVGRDFENRGKLARLHRLQEKAGRFPEGVASLYGAIGRDEVILIRMSDRLFP